MWSPTPELSTCDVECTDCSFNFIWQRLSLEDISFHAIQPMSGENEHKKTWKLFIVEVVLGFYQGVKKGKTKTTTHQQSFLYVFPSPGILWVVPHSEKPGDCGLEKWGCTDDLCKGTKTVHSLKEKGEKKVMCAQRQPLLGTCSD